MGRRAVVVALVIAAIGGAYYYFTVYLPPRQGTDEQQIMRLIVDVQRAVEQSNVSGVMEYISDDYEDRHGLNRRMVHRLVLGAARDRRQINLSVEVPEIEVDGDSARFVAKVGMSVGRGEMADFTVSGELRRERGRWLVVSAEGWQTAGAAYY